MLPLLLLLTKPLLVLAVQYKLLQDPHRVDRHCSNSLSVGHFLNKATIFRMECSLLLRLLVLPDQIHMASTYFPRNIRSLSKELFGQMNLCL